MNAENTAKLLAIAGPLMPPLPIDPRENLMCFGFEVGDGWFELLGDCLRDLCTLRRCGVAPSLILAQVKEKYGTLRMYTHNDDAGNIVYAVLEFAEARSGWTCELCGDRGETAGTGWLTTRCDACRKTKP